MELLFENGRIRVETNGSGEIFVTNLRNPNSQMRIGDYSNCLRVTAHCADLIPGEINGLSAFYVRPFKIKK